MRGSLTVCAVRDDSATKSHDVHGLNELGKFLVVAGVIIALIGLALWGGLAPKWLGRLPGDIRIERGNSGFYFPIVTCVVVSIVLSLILSLFRR